MEIDSKTETANTGQAEAAAPTGVADKIIRVIAEGAEDSKAASNKAVVHPDKVESVEQDSKNFYTEFWSLQRSFAMPTRLFEDGSFKQFKQGMCSTMRKFRSVDQGLQTRSTNNTLENAQRGTKRKRGGQENELSNSFNPKYLTSPDLFDLEVCQVRYFDAGIADFSRLAISHFAGTS